MKAQYNQLCIIINRGRTSDIVWCSIVPSTLHWQNNNYGITFSFLRSAYNIKYNSHDSQFPKCFSFSLCAAVLLLLLSSFLLKHMLQSIYASLFLYSVHTQIHFTHWQFKVKYDNLWAEAVNIYTYLVDKR